MPPPSALSSKNIRKGFLLRRTDFLKTYKGQFVRKELFVLYSRKNERADHRFGITAPKTIGSAVIRNRFKRWGKELYRKASFVEILVPLDINIFIGSKRLKKEDFKNAKFSDFQRQFEESLEFLIRHLK